MTAAWGIAICVAIFFLSMAGMLVVDIAIARLCGTNSRVEAAEDAAREAELQEIVEAGR
jgi:formate-dependent nitrite reductase membrane component NrfD